MTDQAAPDLGYAEEHLIEEMMRLRNRELGTPEEDARQFISGFARILVGTSQGDTEASSAYIGMVVPGLKAANFPFDMMMDGMVRVAEGAVIAVKPEHVEWVAAFCAEYCAQLVRAWMNE